MSASMYSIPRILVYVGNTLTVIGCVGLVLGAIGVIDPEFFAFGISSGVRVIGSVAIVGCLVSAISYGILELQERQLSKATTTKR